MKKLIGCLVYILIAIIGLFGIITVIGLFVINESGSTIAAIVVAVLCVALIYFLLYVQKRNKNIKSAWTMSTSQLINTKEELAEQILVVYKNHLSTSELLHDLDLLKPSQRIATLVYAFKQQVNQLLDKGSVNEEEGVQLISFFESLGLSRQTMQNQNEYVQLSKLMVLTCIFSGKTPTGVNPPSNVFLRFDADEQILATLENAKYYELVEVRSRVGISSGSSIGVGRGRYIRTGAFFSTPITSQQLQEKGKGAFCLTNMNLYFVSNTKTVKFTYDKILSFTPYSDGLGIHLVDSRRRPIVIGNIDGWFVYNIVTNVHLLLNSKE